MQLALILIAIAILVTFSIAGLSAAPWVPTKPKQRKRFIENLEFKDGMTVYDLGCGTGTLLFEALKKNPRIKAIGSEISLLPYIIAKLRLLFGGAKYKNVSVRYVNLFKQDLQEADLVFVFLLSKAYPRLIKKFAKELKDDCRVAVEAWPLPDIKPHQIIEEDELLPIYLYRGEQFRGLV